MRGDCADRMALDDRLRRGLSWLAQWSRQPASPALWRPSGPRAVKVTAATVACDPDRKRNGLERSDVRRCGSPLELAARAYAQSRTTSSDLPSSNAFQRRTRGIYLPILWLWHSPAGDLPERPRAADATGSPSSFSSTPSPPASIPDLREAPGRAKLTRRPASGWRVSGVCPVQGRAGAGPRPRAGRARGFRRAVLPRGPRDPLPGVSRSPSP